VHVDQARRLTAAGVAPEKLADEVAAWLEQQPASVQRTAWADAGIGRD
jgi:hypothetical protein